ncbi:MAG: carbohydrate kinase [Candidatus Omnitrophica bacterium]|nr:carbohydrate kinase [Candidatus Omnitrophota bacterium]
MSDKIILSFGEILWDLLPTGPVLGGAPFNFAYRVHTFKHQSIMISRLGQDDYGRQARDKILELGMDNRFVQWDDKRPTGTVQIRLDENSQPDYDIVQNVAYDFIECAKEILEYASRSHCICYGALAQRNEKSRETLAKILENAPDALKLLDINLRKNCFTPETITHSLEKADFLKLNEDEASHLSGMFGLPAALPDFCAAMIERWSLSHCIVTLGEQGVFARSFDGAEVYSPGFVVDLVDPCGSGDAFTAGFIDRYFRGKDLAECCRFGNALGALVAAQAGATAPISAQEVHEFLDSEPSPIVAPTLRRFMHPD